MLTAIMAAVTVAAVELAGVLCVSVAVYGLAVRIDARQASQSRQAAVQPREDAPAQARTPVIG